jgi:hypothetical protein
MHSGASYRCCSTGRAATQVIPPFQGYKHEMLGNWHHYACISTWLYTFFMAAEHYWQETETTQIAGVTTRGSHVVEADWISKHRWLICFPGGQVRGWGAHNDWILHNGFVQTNRRIQRLARREETRCYSTRIWRILMHALTKHIIACCIT